MLGPPVCKECKLIARFDGCIYYCPNCFQQVFTHLFCFNREEAALIINKGEHMSKFKLGDTAFFITEKKRSWQALKSTKTGLLGGTLNLSSAIPFFLITLDEAINYAETKTDETGPSKKSFVLEALSSLYDSIIGANLPYWAYPFSSMIKSIVIDRLLSQAIDFFVEKYKTGIWNKGE